MPDGTRRLVGLSPQEGCDARPAHCRRYGEFQRGFRGILERLAVHLSIGEAF